MPTDGRDRPPAHPRPTASAAFRLALLVALVFALGAGALLVTVRAQVGRYARQASDGMLEAEMAVLAGERAELGRDGLVSALKRHDSVAEDPPYRYLLVERDGRRLFGDLPRAAAATGRHAVRVEERVGGASRQERMETLGSRLPDGSLLVVATDGFDVGRLRDHLVRSTLLSAFVIVTLVLCGGYAAARLFIARLDHVNRSIDRIVDGDRAERLPAIGFGTEFDELARNLNRMLDRNEGAMEALRQVSTDVAHDLRTPMSRLHQRLERMRRDGADAEGLDMALEQTSQLLATFGALLRIGSIEGGVGRRRFVPVDLAEVMERVRSAMEPVVEDGGRVLVGDLGPGAVVLGDGELLAQAFINLVENAIVHTPPGTSIELVVRDGPAGVLAEVRDDGPGIPPSERDAVFRRFHRLDASRNTEGAGLGLALVAAVAGLHGAAHEIADTAVGTSVRLLFPASAASLRSGAAA